MARRTAFGIKIDVSELEGLADKLAGLTPEAVGALMVDAINETADGAYNLARKTMLGGINLTDSYIQRKMKVEHATTSKPEASIVAFGGKGFTTGLSHYGAMQSTKGVNWSNERIKAAGHIFGKWPGWTRRTGNEPLGIAVNSKASGKSVEVVRGSRKKMGPIFSIPGKKDNDGNLILFRNTGGKKVQALTGPSVYQLFRVAAGTIEDEVYGDMRQRVIDAAERQFEKELT